ncbi:MAG: thermonuclease family protein [Melioribacteraceae bacterium]|nr:thermonuclease family protein [Melioribacteraceae bacterium]MCF8264164.1 thermonuclease family protein [Melioribacteraceae bacterium]MCF8413932.1 thermonuclease family protein [Melioribacteraceae bacterium]MCF8430522.1 thermonuclease family protein [Melioribacteraceae bacterium]
MKNELYYYSAYVTKVYDGDTITVDIDLGLKTFVKGEKIRLYGINTPELRGKERDKGLKARDYLRKLVLFKEITLHTIKDKKGKYGRYLGKVTVKNDDGKIIDVNNDLIQKGFAVKYKG